MHRSSTLPLYSVFYLHGGIFWDVFHAVYLVFSSEVFWRGFLERFFPMGMLATCPK